MSSKPTAANHLKYFKAMISGQSKNLVEYYTSTFYGQIWFLSVFGARIVILLINISLRNRLNSSFVQYGIMEKFEGRPSWFLTVLSYAFLILGSVFLLIVLHGKTFLSIMTHDTFIFFDGAYGLNMGQVPHIDFHTALGAATYLMPYWGLLLKGGFAGSLEFASFLVAVVLTLFSVILFRDCVSRLFSVLTIIFLCSLFAVPIVNVEGTNFITHAMYYNRQGWAALLLVFITYISPETYSKTRLALEAAVLICLLLFLFFLKMTYFIFGAIFLFLLGFVSRQQRHLAISAGVIRLAILTVVEWRLELISLYIEDLRLAIVASGVARNRSFAQVLIDNVMSFLLVLVALGIVIKNGMLQWLDVFFVFFVITAELAIQNQNWGEDNLVVILVILLWNYALTKRKSEDEEAHLVKMHAKDAQVIGILLTFFMVPQLSSGIHGIYSLSVGVATGAFHNKVEVLPKVYIADQGEPSPFLDKVNVEVDRIALFNELRKHRPPQELFQSEYIQTVNDGVKLLKEHAVHSGKCITFDFANPVNFLISAPPAQVDYLWFHVGRNTSEDAHEQAQELFRDVRYVMVPKFSMSYDTMRLLLEIYGQYLKEHYVVLGRSEYWMLYGQPEARQMGSITESRLTTASWHMLH